MMDGWTERQEMESESMLCLCSEKCGEGQEAGRKYNTISAAYQEHGDTFWCYTAAYMRLNHARRLCHTAAQVRGSASSVGLV